MPKTMVIFGSTGTTGLCVTAASLERQFQTRAFCRDPNKIPESLRQRVQICQGDVLDYPIVLEGIKGSDAVIVVLGTKPNMSSTTVLSDGLRNVVKAMKEARVEIISVCLSAFLFFDIESDFVPKQLKDVARDHKRMFEILRASDLKYVAVFPSQISGDPRSGYTVVRDKYISKKVSKFDLADFMVDCLSVPEYYRAVIGIASKACVQSA